MKKNPADKSLKYVLENVKNIAIVGASANPERDSYRVMKFLINYGYKIFPVNPKEIEILGLRCYPSLISIEEKIDMVDIFRAKEHILDHAKEAIRIGASILWMQEGVTDQKSLSLGKSSGLKVIMNECPKKVLEN